MTIHAACMFFSPVCAHNAGRQLAVSGRHSPTPKKQVGRRNSHSCARPAAFSQVADYSASLRLQRSSSAISSEKIWLPPSMPFGRYA